MLDEKNKKAVFQVLSAVAILTFLLTSGIIIRKRLRPLPSKESHDCEVTISPFDDLLRECSDSLFDWKLLSAIAYVESGFDTSLVSPRGASGLMQVMPATYRGYLMKNGLDDTDSISTRQNVLAAKQHLSDMNEQFGFINEKERIKFILGSYNCGAGHVFDAMRIARKNGINRYVWDNIEQIMSTMSEDSVYSDTTVCHLGRFDGTETIMYVRKVMKKYREYQELDSLSVD